MPNEFKVKNGLIVDQGGANITGSSAISGSLAIMPQDLMYLLLTALQAVSSQSMIPYQDPYFLSIQPLVYQ